MPKKIDFITVATDLDAESIEISNKVTTWAKHNIASMRLAAAQYVSEDLINKYVDAGQLPALTEEQKKLLLGTMNSMYIMGAYEIANEGEGE